MPNLLWRDEHRRPARTKVRCQNGTNGATGAMMSVWPRRGKPTHGRSLQLVAFLSSLRVTAPALPAPRDSSQHATAVTAHSRPRREHFGHLERVVVLLVSTRFVRQVGPGQNHNREYRNRACWGRTGAMTTSVLLSAPLYAVANLFHHSPVRGIIIHGPRGALLDGGACNNGPLTARFTKNGNVSTSSERNFGPRW